MKNELSVLIIQPWLNYRGAESVSIALCKDLNGRGVNSKIMCLFISDAVASVLDRDQLILPHPFFQGVFRNRIVFMLFGFWCLLFLCMKNGHRFTVFNPHNFPSVWVGVVCGLIFRKRVVWTVHNFPQHPFRGVLGTLFEFIILPLDFLFARKVDTIVSVSHKVSDIVKMKYSKLSFVIYPGIDLDFWFSQELKLIPVAYQGKRILLHVGQIRTEKKQDYTLELFRSLAESCPELVLIFAGERIVNSFPDMRRIPELLQQRIIFTGRITKEELHALYSVTEFLIFPSSWGEGCSLVPLEAMASGVTHVLVSRGCGVDEILTDSGKGIVFDTDGEIHLVAELVKKRYQSRSKEDYMEIIQNFSHSHFTDEYLNIFKR
ncbi:MAG: glycosyltransferase family 4 protein [bacterium]|nr:glycosyltransferase family 4 protein [bacterium]